MYQLINTLMYRKLLFLIITIFTFQGLYAQQELGLHMMRSLGQAGKTNPAIAPKEKLFIGIPGAAFNYYHTAGAINDLLKKENGQNILDLDELIVQADPENDLNIDLELETIRLHYRLGKVSLSFNHAIKSNTFIHYPKTLPQLFWQGNGQFVGQEVNFGPEQQSSAYNEFGLGVALDLGKLSIGGRAKFLSGIGDVSTDREQASLHTSDDIYQLRLQTDYNINTSTFAPTFLFDSLGTVGVEYSFDDILSFNDIFTSNTGYAFDLGLTYQLTEKLELAVSVIDLGQITWNDKVTQYRSTGSFEYDGLDISNIFQDDELDFGGTLDTLEQIFDFKESSNDYTTKLAGKVYASATYQLNDRWELGGMYYSEHFRGRTNVAAAVSANTRIGKFVQLGASYAMRNESFANVGLNVIATVGTFQLYAVTDNVIGMISPYDSENVNGRIGLNIILN